VAVVSPLALVAAGQDSVNPPAWLSHPSQMFRPDQASGDP